MSDAENRFEVEKILARKLADDGLDVSTNTKISFLFMYYYATIFSQFEYLLKWKGYRDRTWGPRANLDECDEMLRNFELKQAKRAISELIFRFFIEICEFF